MRRPAFEFDLRQAYDIDRQQNTVQQQYWPHAGNNCIRNKSNIACDRDQPHGRIDFMQNVTKTNAEAK
jgi:hypothetical protein